jgi:vacuolar-type H+-ATPase subunit H
MSDFGNRLIADRNDPDVVRAAASRELAAADARIAELRSGIRERDRIIDAKDEANKRLREACEPAVKSLRAMLGVYPAHEWQDVRRKAINDLSQAECALLPQPNAVSLTESLETLRAAGGDAWDKVEDVEGYLGRKNDTQTGAS